MKSLAIHTFAVLVFLLSSGPVSAQVTVSVWGGLNVVTMIRTELDGGPDRSGSPYGHARRRAIGLGVGIPVSDRWGIQLNISDSQKGADISQPDVTATWKHDYLELSLLADVPLRLGDGDRARLHILLGPALAFKRSCEVTAVYQGTKENLDCGDESRWKPFKDLDYGAVGGAEVEFELSSRIAATFGALYNYGLLDINDRPDWPYIEKNRTLTLRAGLKFLIG